jgi:hypothetical protein
MLSRTVFVAVFLSATALTASAQVKPVLPSDAAARPRTPEAQATLDASTQELMREMKLLGINQLRQPKEASFRESRISPTMTRQGQSLSEPSAPDDFEGRRQGHRLGGLEQAPRRDQGAVRRPSLSRPHSNPDSFPMEQPQKHRSAWWSSYRKQSNDQGGQSHNQRRAVQIGKRKTLMLSQFQPA